MRFLVKDADGNVLRTGYAPADQVAQQALFMSGEAALDVSHIEGIIDDGLLKVDEDGYLVLRDDAPEDATPHGLGHQAASIG